MRLARMSGNLIAADRTTPNGTPISLRKPMVW
jgi:hypothetical protein